MGEFCCKTFHFKAIEGENANGHFFINVIEVEIFHASAKLTSESWRGYVQECFNGENILMKRKTKEINEDDQINKKEEEGKKNSVRRAKWKRI